MPISRRDVVRPEERDTVPRGRGVPPPLGGSTSLEKEKKILAMGFSLYVMRFPHSQLLMMAEKRERKISKNYKLLKILKI